MNQEKKTEKSDLLFLVLITILAVALATALNFAVIACNGFSMPVTPIVYDYPALASLIDRIEAGALPEYALVGWDAPLWFLGDTIPLFGGLASAGDLLMAAGMFLLIFDLLRQNPPAQNGPPL